jgi:RNase P protein component
MFTVQNKNRIRKELRKLIADAHKLNSEKNGCAVVIVDRCTGKPVFQEFIGKMRNKEN